MEPSPPAQPRQRPSTRRRPASLLAAVLLGAVAGLLAAPLPARAQACPPQAPWFCDGCDGYCCPVSHRFCTSRCTCSAAELACPPRAPYFCEGHGGYCCPASHRFCTSDGACSDDSDAAEGLAEPSPQDDWTCTAQTLDAGVCPALVFCVDRLTAEQAFYEADGRTFPCEAADRIDRCLTDALNHCDAHGAGGAEDAAPGGGSGCAAGGRPAAATALLGLAVLALPRRRRRAPATDARPPRPH